MAVKVIISGAAGRMGRELIAAVDRDSNLELAGGFEAFGHPLAGQDLGMLALGRMVGLTLEDSFEKSLTQAGSSADVMIDFTTIDATLSNLPQAAQAGMAAVIGTTGFSADQKEGIELLAQKVPIVMAPNMSIGINVFYKLAAMAAEMLGESYDIEIYESHHKHKVDAPSGTARVIAEVLAGVRGQNIDYVGRFERHGTIGPRKDGEIGVSAIRAGDIVGDHTVLLAGSGERIELTHRAHSRANFASGAAEAAGWVFGRKPGLYDMQDVLGLK